MTRSSVMVRSTGDQVREGEDSSSRAVGTASLLGDGRRWRRSFINHSEVSTRSSSSLKGFADDARLRRRSPKMSPSEGGNDSFVLAREQVKINNALTNPKASVADLIKVAKTNRHMFNTVNWATLFHRLARFHAKEAATSYGPEIKALLQQCRLEEDCSCQHLANLSWAMAKLRIVDMNLLRTVVEKALAMSHLMNPPDVTNLCWSLAKARTFLDDPAELHELKDIVNEMFSYVVDKIHFGASSFLKDFKPVELSSVMWATATVRDISAPVAEVFPDICDITSSYCVAHLPVDTFPPASLASLAWALSVGRDEAQKSLTSSPRTSFRSLSVLMTRSSEYLHSRSRLMFKLKAKDLAQLLWAIVGSGVVHEEFQEKAYHSIELVMRTSQKPLDASAVPGLFRSCATAIRLGPTVGKGKPIVKPSGCHGRNSCSSVSTAATETEAWSPMSLHLFEKLVSALADAKLTDCTAEDKDYLPGSLNALMAHFKITFTDHKSCFHKCIWLTKLLNEDFLASKGSGWSPSGVLGLVELDAKMDVNSCAVLETFNLHATHIIEGHAKEVEDCVELLNLADSRGFDISRQTLDSIVLLVRATKASPILHRASLVRLAFLATFSALNTYPVLPIGLLEPFSSPFASVKGTGKNAIEDDAILSMLACALSHSESSAVLEMLAGALCELVKSKDERAWSDLHTVAIVQGLRRVSPQMLPSFVEANLVPISQGLDHLTKSHSPTLRVLAGCTLDIVIQIVGSGNPSTFESAGLLVNVRTTSLPMQARLLLHPSFSQTSSSTRLPLVAALWLSKGKEELIMNHTLTRQSDESVFVSSQEEFGDSSAHNDQAAVAGLVSWLWELKEDSKKQWQSISDRLASLEATVCKISQSQHNASDDMARIIKSKQEDASLDSMAGKAIAAAVDSRLTRVELKLSEMSHSGDENELREDWLLALVEGKVQRRLDDCALIQQIEQLKDRQTATEEGLDKSREASNLFSESIRASLKQCNTAVSGLQRELSRTKRLVQMAGLPQGRDSGSVQLNRSFTGSECSGDGVYLTQRSLLASSEFIKLVDNAVLKQVKMRMEKSKVESDTRAAEIQRELKVIDHKVAIVTRKVDQSCRATEALQAGMHGEQEAMMMKMREVIDATSKPTSIAREVENRVQNAIRKVQEEMAVMRVKASQLKEDIEKISSEIGDSRKQSDLEERFKLLEENIATSLRVNYGPLIVEDQYTVEVSNGS
ncbi:hypothetical protein FOL47_006123 [Perkinsus chesapeaki]|uniref:Uncharacterized protein n=1 Tax=Perkinsus chesapeaki TaxID=330153 RepID=A0A7J6MXZ6_PERCH|nr:hypothetical protein FOL47_006123 [Perkinsus chesapeaki]